MGRAIVCLTFDFDAISGWIARGMTTPGPISRGEFGPRVPFWAAAGLMMKRPLFWSMVLASSWSNARS